MLRDATLEDGTTLVTDDEIIEGVILDAEVETTWLDALLTGAEEDAEVTAFEPGEDTCDA